MEFNFSFKTAKEEKLEKYPNLPVLTYIGGSRTKKFQLNKKAAELLQYNVTGKINLGVTSTNQLFLANTFGKENGHKSDVFSDNSFANAKYVDRINRHFDINIIEGQEFALVETEALFPALLIDKNAPEGRTTDDFSEFPDEDFDESSNEDFDESYILKPNEVEVYSEEF